MKFLNVVNSLAILFFLVAGCSKKPQPVPPLDPKNMDLTVSPGTDFYQYANGNWIKSHPIPDEYSRYGAFEQLIEQNYKELKSLLKEAAKNKAQQGSIEQKIGDFYATGMDTTKIEKDGVSPLKSEFQRITAIKSKKNIQNEIAHLQLVGPSPLFDVGSGQDEKNTETVIAQLYQGGIGLPDRDYYISDDNRSKEIRKEYVKHIAKMFRLLGDDADKAGAESKTVMNIETQLAKASMTRLERRDPHKTYNKMSLKNLQRLSHNIDWADYFKNIGLENVGDINVGQPHFFKEISKMIKTVGVDDWKTYLRWNLINRSANYLSTDFVKEDFAFYGAFLSGQKVMKPRWKRVLSATNGALGEAVGQLYVKKYFPPEAKKRMLNLVMNLKSVLRSRIQKLDWMSESTKKQALKKLDAMNVKIGYPDKWIDYSKLEIKRDSYIANLVRANQFNFHREMNKIGKPVDRTEWHMNPQTVNAYYNPTMNEIVFPAAILQPPFFNNAADDAVNYGAIGVVIGHEMTHGFDDQGRNFDTKGNLRDWWTKEDEKRFNARAQVLAKQFNNYVVLDSLHVNGELTLGENIADLGGLNISYQALEKSLKGKPRPEKIDGFTPEQRFFLAFAQVWRQNIRPKAQMRRLKEDVHSPGRFRTDGPVSNMPEFYKAFDVKPGDPLYRPKNERAIIW